MTDVIKAASAGITLVDEIMKAAGDNAQVKEAGNNLGKTALKITKTINNVLLPLDAVNFAFDKARKYFDDKFSEDLSAMVAAIPVEHLKPGSVPPLRHRLSGRPAQRRLDFARPLSITGVAHC